MSFYDAQYIINKIADSPQRTNHFSTMYQYTENDQTLIDERVAQFKRQTENYFKGELTEDEYRALRLRNGVYIQTHAPLLRVAGLMAYSILNKCAN